MLRGIVISPDVKLRGQLEERLAESRGIGITRSLDRYPQMHELTRVIRAYAPQVLFVSIASMEKALGVVQVAERVVPGIQLVAVHDSCDSQTLLELMRAGIREFLAPPFELQAVIDLAARLNQALEKRPAAVESTDLVFSFLPSKAGVGTSTLAVSTSLAITQAPDTTGLLADFDLNSGIVGFMLKLENVYSIVDAAEHALHIDENLWPQLVTSVNGLDVLHAGKLHPEFRIEGTQIRQLLDFARRNYKIICVDLSGNLEKYSIELMHESKRVFLVCTPEIPSLHLAREKYNYLKSLDLGDRVRVLLNRCQKRGVVTPTQVEGLLGLPVYMAFPNDYQGVHRALEAGSGVEPSSELGKQIQKLAHSLVDKNSAPETEPKRRFVEYFSIIPARYSASPSRRQPDPKKRSVV